MRKHIQYSAKNILTPLKKIVRKRHKMVRKRIKKVRENSVKTYIKCAISSFMRFVLPLGLGFQSLALDFAPIVNFFAPNFQKAKISFSHQIK